jgi:hypothetical protein
MPTNAPLPSLSLPQNQRLDIQLMISKQYLGFVRGHQVVAYLCPLFLVSMIDPITSQQNR